MLILCIIILVVAIALCLYFAYVRSEAGDFYGALILCALAGIVAGGSGVIYQDLGKKANPKPYPVTPKVQPWASSGLTPEERAIPWGGCELLESELEFTLYEGEPRVERFKRKEYSL